MPRLPPLLRPMPSLAMDTTAVDTEDTMARGRLRLPLMLSPAMDTMAVDMAVMVTDVSMVDTVDTAEDTTARGRLMLRPSPDMDTTAVDTDMAATDTDVSMVDTADTTDKFKSSGINLHSFTATFILVLKLSLVLPQNF